MLCHEFGHGVVVDSAELGGDIRLDTVEHRQRVRRQQLDVDAITVHRPESAIDIHEQAAAITHRLHLVFADAEVRNTFAVFGEVGAVTARLAETGFQHNVGVNVDDRHGGNPQPCGSSMKNRSRGWPVVL